jgi:hypothetical protein
LNRSAFFAHEAFEVHKDCPKNELLIQLGQYMIGRLINKNFTVQLFKEEKNSKSFSFS